MDLQAMQSMTMDIQDKKELAENLDYKMVTFSLSGKDYGVNIMNIKEIAKADKFTYVPNAAGFVRGVYNLRGDIIPIIDLRMFFNLPIPPAEPVIGINGQSQPPMENMLILVIQDKVYGVIVDKIAKVVAIDSSTIQPSHPIFGDVNMKYISGVVEKDGALYIILDVVRIFSQNKEDKDALKDREGGQTGDDIMMMAQMGASAVPNPAMRSGGQAAAVTAQSENPVTSSNLGFIKEGLAALKKFYASGVNEDWVVKRLKDWTLEHSASDVQFKNAEDAEKYIQPFYSKYTNRLWSQEYADQVKNILPNPQSNSIQVWNPGCGKGYESFSIACLLKTRFPDARIKIWANDNDIMSITNAPNLSFDDDELPAYCKPFVTKGKTGLVFNQTIKDSVVFEYHDVANTNTVPDLDYLFCRDTLSFIPTDGQQKLLADMLEHLKQGGFAMVGDNEKLAAPAWIPIGGGGSVSAFKKA